MPIALLALFGMLAYAVEFLVHLFSVSVAFIYYLRKCWGQLPVSGIPLLVHVCLPCACVASMFC